MFFALVSQVGSVKHLGDIMLCGREGRDSSWRCLPYATLFWAVIALRGRMKVEGEGEGFGGMWSEG